MNPYKYEHKPEFDFDNPADFKKLEQMAYDMTIDIDEFPPAAYRYFDKLRNLYARYKYDNLLKESAEIEKKKLFTEYQREFKSGQRFREVYKTYQDNIRKAGTLLSDIEKSDNIADIAIKACRVIGLMTGDESFEKRQESKIFKEEL